MAGTLLFACACGTTGATPTGPTAVPPRITQVSPSTVAVGETITISGSGFTASGNTIKLGSGYAAAVASANSTTLTWTVPGGLGVCPPSTQVCVALAMVVSPGNYAVSVINANGTSNELPLQIVVR